MPITGNPRAAAKDWAAVHPAIRAAGNPGPRVAATAVRSSIEIPALSKA